MVSREKGFAFIPFLLGNWRLIVYGAVILAVVGFVWNCERVKTNHQELIASMKIAAEENDKRVKIAIAQAKKDKEKADESYKRTVASLQFDIKRLRDNPPSSFLPPAAPGSPSPERATRDRAEFNAALRSYREAVIGLIEEGDSGIAALDTVKQWAQ